MLQPKTIEFLVYLETQLVHHGGMINIRTLHNTDITRLRGWEKQGLIIPEEVPPPRVIKEGSPLYTHKIKFTRQMWDIAASARREYAAKYQVTLPKEHLNGQVEKLIDKADEKKLLNPEEFRQFMEDHNNPLTEPEWLAVQQFFKAWNIPKLKWWLAAKDMRRGPEWLLKAFTQFWHWKITPETKPKGKN